MQSKGRTRGWTAPRPALRRVSDASEVGVAGGEHGVEARHLQFAPTLLTGFLVMAMIADLPQDAFTVHPFLEPAQRPLHRLAFFQPNFSQRYFHILSKTWVRRPGRPRSSFRSRRARLEFLARDCQRPKPRPTDRHYRSGIYPKSAWPQQVKLGQQSAFPAPGPAGETVFRRANGGFRGESSGAVRAGGGGGCVAAAYSGGNRLSPVGAVGVSAAVRFGTTAARPSRALPRRSCATSSRCPGSGR